MPHSSKQFIVHALVLEYWPNVKCYKNERRGKRSNCRGVGLTLTATERLLMMMCRVRRLFCGAVH